MTSLAYFHDCHCRYDERSIVQKKKILHCLFEKGYHHPTPYAPQSSWWGASDASASDAGEAYVGGWISNQPHPEKNQVWWFHYQVKEDQHPWAFKDSKPKRRIAALEMLGTLFLTMYLCKKSSSLRGPVLLPLASDNQGNIYGLAHACVIVLYLRKAFRKMF